MLLYVWSFNYLITVAHKWWHIEGSTKYCRLKFIINWSFVMWYEQMQLNYIFIAQNIESSLFIVYDICLILSQVSQITIVLHFIYISTIIFFILLTYDKISLESWFYYLYEVDIFPSVFFVTHNVCMDYKAWAWHLVSMRLHQLSLTVFQWI